MFRSGILVLLVACGTPVPRERGAAGPARKVIDTPRTTGEEVDDRSAQPVRSVSSIRILNGRLHDGYIVGGLPTKQQIDEAIEADIESAMSLMANDEPGVVEIATYATSRGFRYIRFTVAGEVDLTEAMAWQFAATLAMLDRPAIIHSAGGQRVGAMFALMAFFVDEVAPEEAYQIGMAAGMGDLAGRVRDILGLPPE